MVISSNASYLQYRRTELIRAEREDAMLHDTGNAMTADWLDRPVTARSSVPNRPRAVRPVVVEAALARSGGRYGDSAGFSFSALGVTILIHVVLGLVLLGLGAHTAHKKKIAHLVTMDLSTPPPAPASPPDKPTTQKLAVTVQQPVVQTPTAQQPMMALAPPAPASAPPSAAPPAAETPPAQPAPPAPPSLVTASNLGTRMITGSPPHYPMESRSKREQGTVELLIILGVNGAVETISISRSSGFPRLDTAALGAVRRWRWAPTLRDGAPVKVRGIVEIPFVLQGA